MKYPWIVSVEKGMADATVAEKTAISLAIKSALHWRLPVASAIWKVIMRIDAKRSCRSTGFQKPNLQARKVEEVVQKLENKQREEKAVADSRAEGKKGRTVSRMITNMLSLCMINVSLVLIVELFNSRLVVQLSKECWSTLELPATLLTRRHGRISKALSG